LKVFDVEQKKLKKTLLCHKSQIMHFACDMEGTHVVTCSANSRALRLWNVDRGEKLVNYAIVDNSADIIGLLLS